VLRDAARKATDIELRRLERAIEHEYKRAYSEMYNKWWQFMSSFEEREKPYLERLAKAMESGNGVEIGAAKRSYRSFISKYTLQSQEYARMRDQLAAKLANLDAAMYELTNGKLANIYALNYNYLAGQLPKAYAYGLINPKTVEGLALKHLNLVKATWWNMDRMNKEVLQGILQGESMRKIAQRFQSVFSMNKVSAIRNARTAVTNAENWGRFQSYQEAEKQGVVLVKKWTATHDARTRDSHRELDGAEVAVDMPFANGLMCPGDPAGAGAEVYNCRCAMGARIIGFKDKNGVIHYVED
jgi:SPP1 gp7 family putative phage head morphogenesis protein